MRTTLTLDPDVARLLDDAVHQQRRPLKQVVNDALRRALAPARRTAVYRVAPHHSPVRPGLDLAGFNRMADQLEDEELGEAIRPAS